MIESILKAKNCNLGQLNLQHRPRLTKKGWNVYNLYIWHWQSKLLTDITLTVERYSADNQWSTHRPSVDRYIDRDICRLSVDMLTVTRPISRLIHRSIRWPTYLGRFIGQELVDMSTDISVHTWPICQPINRSSVSRYVNRYISRGVHKIHMIQEILVSCTGQEYDNIMTPCQFFAPLSV